MFRCYVYYFRLTGFHLNLVCLLTLHVSAVDVDVYF